MDGHHSVPLQRPPKRYSILLNRDHILDRRRAANTISSVIQQQSPVNEERQNGQNGALLQLRNRAPGNHSSAPESRQLTGEPARWCL